MPETEFVVLICFLVSRCKARAYVGLIVSSCTLGTEVVLVYVRQMAWRAPHQLIIEFLPDLGPTHGRASD
jgi:hypothetical protein